MKAKRIAEITANIVDLKNQVSTLSDELNKEHGATGAASMIAQAIIARETAKIAMLKAELSAVIQSSVKKNSEQSITPETSLPKQSCNVATEVTFEQEPHPFDGRAVNRRLIVKLENGVEVIYKIKDGDGY